MPLPAINHRSLLFLYLHLCVIEHTLKVCEHGILQTICGNFAKFISYVQLGRKMKEFSCEVKGQGHSVIICGQMSTLWEFHQMYILGEVGNKDELIAFFKSKSQAQDECE